MKKFLFVGGTNGNTGPANVNKGIVANLSDAFCIADSVNKVKKYINASPFGRYVDTNIDLLSYTYES